MANTVVKVSDIKDEELDDSLLLLVGEDGTVTPDQDTVETYLKQRNGPTNLQILKFNRSEMQGIDITVDTVTYVPDVVNEEIVKTDLEEVENRLHSIRLDHDYYIKSTDVTNSSILLKEDDELARTLSILDGPEQAHISALNVTEPPPLVMTTSKTKPKVNLIQSITINPPSTGNKANSSGPPVLTPEVPLPTLTKIDNKSSALRERQEKLSNSNKEKNDEETMEAEPPPRLSPNLIPKAKMKTVKTIKTLKPKITKPKEVVQQESTDEDGDDYLDVELDTLLEENSDDSDFDIEHEKKIKAAAKRINKRFKQLDSKSTPIKTPRKRNKNKEQKEIRATELLEETLKQKKEEAKVETKEIDKLVEKEKQETEVKPPEKKPAKREKRTPKPIPDDFALFSTPDIIRRVGGKDPATPTTPDTPNKPAKIGFQESRKSVENPQSVVKNRLSVDSNEKEKEKDKDKITNKVKEADKNKDTKERRISQGEVKAKRLSVDDKTKPKDIKPERRISDAKKTEKSLKSSKLLDASAGYGEMATVEDIRAIILSEDTKTFTIDPNIHNTVNQSLDSSNINLDTTGLDLDPALLENLNNDEISEDILYQVAQSLVSNPELQNAIEKGINEGVLDPMAVDNVNVREANVSEPTTNDRIIQGATQIVRPDGRVIIIPPVERPTTRSRNKKPPVEEVKPPKPVHKPLDEEHVSGNELDSSNDEEEESEDDPNKLWCICNQPHNNRFMICCDTCEEWYHGKCVNITKAMGQQMEAEGREWICLFCKDPKLKRPQAAARRIRKASRNSRTSTESTGSFAKKAEGAVSAIPCVVCQKPARSNSIYCSENCILTHAQGIERVVVFERATGKMLTGNKAPSAANLDQWLKEHPGYEVVRSGGKVVTAKSGNLSQTKLKLVKNSNNQGVSLAVQKKGGINVGVMKHSPKHQQQQLEQQQLQHQQVKSALKASLIGAKQTANKVQASPKESPKLKSSSDQLKSPTTVTPQKPKLLQTKLKQPQGSTEKKPKSTPVSTVGMKEKLAAIVADKSPTTIKEKSSPTMKEKSTVVPKEKPVVNKDRTPSVGTKEKTAVKTPKQRKDSVKDKEETTPQKPAENIRETVKNTVCEQLINRLKGVDDLKLTDDEVKSMSTEIESQLYKCFGDTGQKYRTKYRSLIFNIKDVKNQTLWRRICEKNISPYELVRLSTDDMANQELAQWREKEAKHQLDMIKKSELELLNCNRQYVLKTHKGEQVVEDDIGNKVDNTEMIKSLTEGSALDSGDSKGENSKERDKKGSSKHGHRDRERKIGRDKDYGGHRISSRDRDRDKDRSRKRSRSRDRKRGDRKKRSRSKDRDRSRHRKSSHKSSRHKRDIISSTDKLDKKSKEILEQLVDNKIVPPLEDRLWKHVPQEDIVPAMESDSDHEPSSTVTIPTPPRVSENEDEKNQPISPEKEKEIYFTVRSTSPPLPSKPTEIWRGVINMVDVAQISITAHEVSGDCSGLNNELTTNLDIVGRISPETVWDYIGKMKCSVSKSISLIRLNATNIEEKMPYLALYSYLSSRDRLGVVKSLNKAVKDFYIYPLAPQKPIPQVLLPISGPGFEESRPALLLGIIVRDKRKRPYIDSIPVTNVSTSKKSRISTPPLPIAPPPTAPPPPPLPTRSYTPPPVKDPRLINKSSTVASPAIPTVVPITVPPPSLSIPITIPPPIISMTVPPPTLAPAASAVPEGPTTTPPLLTDEGDEPYSPGDSSGSDVVASTPPLKLSSGRELSPTHYPEIPGLTMGFPSSSLDVQRQIEELNLKIEKQKSEITSMTKNIVSAGITQNIVSANISPNIAAASSEIGTSALANIALPTNLQQILDSIKSIGDTTESPSMPKDTAQTDLTIPLMIPKSFSRPLSNSSTPIQNPLQKSMINTPSDTIPLKLPSKPLIKPSSVNSPLLDDKPSVLSSLSEEELIKKAAEMLGETEGTKRRDTSTPLTSLNKRLKTEVCLPPVPGLEDET
ncbi:uncharacterized protein LOC130902588 isoform X2 [Diorhabda carinulata]|uniref:uncharacterized protein LOC130902588 isoform X2 n=1 Tax=Diorhabda carinulata TaxID=1163345 RepID=UPI0025A16090|nr:uncharacterized protein LOC130902588 isoform X2 [Diorhabda carinulata]